MLSRSDILKEINRKLAIFPFNEENLKENSYNLCTSEFSWTLGEGNVIFIKNKKEFQIRPKDEVDSHEHGYSFKKGDKVIVEEGGNKYIILLPNTTTLIETNEVISIPGYLGGRVHSKVGVVNMGIGHIGTMLGPNFHGHLLIALHNITEKVITLKVNESFISATFDYLDTPIYTESATVSGHTDKMAALGIKISKEDTDSLNEDWKKQSEKIYHKMKTSEEFKSMKKKQLWEYSERFKKKLTVKNILTISVIIIICFALGCVAHYLDETLGGSSWSDRFWNVIASGVVVSLLSTIMNNLKYR